MPSLCRPFLSLQGLDCYGSHGWVVAAHRGKSEYGNHSTELGNSVVELGIHIKSSIPDDEGGKSLK